MVRRHRKKEDAKRQQLGDSQQSTKKTNMDATHPEKRFFTGRGEEIEKERGRGEKGEKGERKRQKSKGERKRRREKTLDIEALGQRDDYLPN